YAHEFVQGSLSDFDTVYRFGQGCDLITIEIENVNTEALEALQAEGKTVYPYPKTIRLIQDKRVQKQFYQDRGLPTAPFQWVENQVDVREKAHTFPVVNKLARLGYDGRGVQVLRSAADLDKAFDAPGLLEAFVPFEKEIAVLVARNPQGEMAVYPVVEMLFHPEQNLVEYLSAPAEITEEQSVRARDIACQLAGALNYVGILAVEMFLTREGTIYINESAPRPHNSGHHTIRACSTSQYEQHLRAILGLPLGSTEQLCPAAMLNMLGEPGHSGPVRLEGIEEALAIPGVYPHFYGKAETRPFRKMGHVTILGHSQAELREKAERVRQVLKVVSGGGVGI
ncbi:MAG: 5-(carboxyamino)imidazole ribonucleotide synthase, partial [Bacteroidetes bacterium]